ncbi:MAG TPA: hypothetical protein VFS31_06210, partial [Chitinophagaceae bacterium]|nr:hypothetical protein [Chitinophagaceae bacterium]
VIKSGYLHIEKYFFALTVSFPGIIYLIYRRRGISLVSFLVNRNFKWHSYVNFAGNAFIKTAGVINQIRIAAEIFSSSLSNIS